MNIAPLLTRRLRESARGLVGWTLGLAAVCALYLPLFPSMRTSGLLGDKLEAMPTEMLDSLGMDAATMGTGWGYTHETVFSMLGMLLLLVVGITHGARAIAGDEESGALELTLAHATDRRSVLLARLIGVVAVVVGLTTFTTLLVAALNGPSELGLSADGLLGEGVALGLLVLVHALVAFAVGAATGRRSLALGVATAVAALGWFVHTMGAKVQENLPAASPFEWAYGSDPLVNGPDPGGLLALAATCIVLIALAAITFPRRDLRA
ncbi:ABC transporter permease subunit [Mobilicoccus pelagius]|uniref:Putative ABC transporter permease protein n=1 Tax=Mobilicoccus pelagius NBRC 104925 TaxID=1089455 RepID=H5UQL1_9MICO|nr:ABC transporter permease subunit [Mobilicoccus pelagius]GAB48019.1 putative ABC transporter permease protein [Mobilicoccus pelagius NBRC 104925]